MRSNTKKTKTELQMLQLEVAKPPSRGPEWPPRRSSSFLDEDWPLAGWVLESAVFGVLLQVFVVCWRLSVAAVSWLLRGLPLRALQTRAFGAS